MAEWWIDNPANPGRASIDNPEVQRLVQSLRQRWIPAVRLPAQLVHGDARLGNVCLSAQDDTIYLDFGFLALRPRVHDLAYALAFMVLALGAQDEPSVVWRQTVPALLAAYEAGAKTRLSDLERAAMAVYTASVPLYFVAIAGFSPDPLRHLHAYRTFLHLSEWLLSAEGAAGLPATT